MAYNVHAGHTKTGTIGSGAKSLLDESVENRKIVKEMVRILKDKKKLVYDCTNDKASSERDNLVKIVNACNRHEVKIDVSVHLNSGAKDLKGNGKSCGFEVWVCPGGKTVKTTVAKKMCKNMEELGFTNRGIKTSENLYVLNHTNNPAVLVEVCFVDDKDDYKLYQKVGYKKIAKALVDAML